MRTPLTRSQKVFCVLALLSLAGCARVTPGRDNLDRIDYGQVIAESWKRQTRLLNVVRTRYADAPVFLDVSSVINTYSLSLLFRSAHIRLSTREAWEVHRKNIEWGAQFSEDQLPDKAIGANPATLLIMRWALQKWERVAWLNRYFAGTWPPRIEMDLLPGFFCGAHFLIVADKPLETADDFIAGGRAMQRFWLTATSLALQFQPEMTPLIFSSYRRQGLTFAADAAAVNRADEVRYGLASLMGIPAPETCGVFMGRVGAGPTPTSRSLRKSLARLGVR